MRVLVTLILAILTAGVLVYVAYMQYPRVTVHPYKVTRMVPEQRIRTVTKQVEVNGETVEVEVDVYDTHYKPVWEERVHHVGPSPLQTLRFWVLVGAAILYGLYVLAVLGLFVWDKIKRRRESTDTRDTKQRVDGITNFCVGVLVGIVATVNLDTVQQQVDETMQGMPIESQVDEPGTPPVGHPDTPRFRTDVPPRVGDPGTPTYTPRGESRQPQFSDDEIRPIDPPWVEPRGIAPERAIPPRD